PWEFEAIASPLYTAERCCRSLRSTIELSTATNACVRSTAGLQPLRVPSSVANMNKLEPDVAPFDTRKPLPDSLNTFPSGAAVVPAGEPGGRGMVTTNGLVTVAPEITYTLAKPVPLSEIQKGPVGLAEMPQGFTRLASVWLAPGMSETRLVR